MTELSAAAYAVLNAWGNVIRADNYEGRVEVPIAAALRAAADQLHPDLLGVMGDFYSVQSQLRTIASELEAQ
jgi:hypothetical protein